MCARGLLRCWYGRANVVVLPTFPRKGISMASLVEKYGSESAALATPITEHPDFPAPVVLDESETATLERIAASSISESVEDLSVPYNAVTGAAYRGKNIDRLLSAEIIGNYGPGGWAGFKQWLTVGRVVRKGEHGTACVTVIGKREGSDDQPAEDAKGGARRGGGVRGFRVFHFDQTTELVEEG